MEGRMRKKYSFSFIRLAKSCCLLGMVVLLVFTLLKVGTATPEGLWCDEDGFWIEFTDHGTYRDSQYGVALPYTWHDNIVTFTDVTGAESVSLLERNYGKRVDVLLNGVSHEMYPCDITEIPTPPLKESVGVYRIKQLAGVATLRLYSDNSYSYKVADSLLEGKYIWSSASLVLLNSEGEVLDTFVVWDKGFAVGEAYSDITADVVRQNALESGGLRITGLVQFTDAGLSYVFDSDNSVIRSVTGGDDVELAYFVDSSGLIVMTDLIGGGQKDYLWIDTTVNKVYRYVFELDNWSAYVEQG